MEDCRYLSGRRRHRLKVVAEITGLTCAELAREIQAGNLDAEPIGTTFIVNEREIVDFANHRFGPEQDRVRLTGEPDPETPSMHDLARQRWQNRYSGPTDHR